MKGTERIKKCERESVNRSGQWVANKWAEEDRGKWTEKRAIKEGEAERVRH